MRQFIDEFISAHPGVLSVPNTITIQMGPKVMLAAKVELDGDMRMADGVGLINALERSLKNRFPEIGWCFIEPDDKF